MKKVIYLAAIASMVLFCTSCRQKNNKMTEQNTTIADNAHTSQNSLDWEGVYQGIIPCADCEGINVQILLKQDGTYEKSDIYLGKQNELFKSTGKFSWNSEGQIITLEGQESPNQYFVGENTLYQLDIEGKQIEGDFAEMYILHKK